MIESREIRLQDLKKYLEGLVSLGLEEVWLPRATSEEQSFDSLDSIRSRLGECTRCPLSHTRKCIVFGEGNPEARLMFIGEGPGADEDREGRPFVGKAGQLLTKMISAMGIHRSHVYIANVVKCRPPKNRNPEKDEIEACFPFLRAQIQSVNPEVIVALGKVAAGALLNTSGSISALRGRFQFKDGVAVMPTYHPSFLLRAEHDKQYKAQAWSDLKKVMAHLDLPIPGSGGTL